MKFPKLFGRKKRKREELLIKEYEQGRILQVDNNIDNKEFLKSIQDDKQPKPTEEQIN